MIFLFESKNEVCYEHYDMFLVSAESQDHAVALICNENNKGKRKYLRWWEDEEKRTIQILDEKTEPQILLCRW